MSECEDKNQSDQAGSRTGLQVLQEALEKYAKNRDEDVTMYSEIPERCKVSLCYAGIDEAGRGPVLGPMVYAIFASVADQESIDAQKAKGSSISKIEDCPPVLIDCIKKLNDSKQLNESVREDIFAQFSELDYAAFGIKIISPAQIALQSYKRQKVSLNEISHQAAMELVQGLVERGVKISKVYVDTVGPMDKYQKKLEVKFPDLRFKVDKKADSKYKPVSAASICAKVARDQILKAWTFVGKNVTVGSDGWGSGYPADPVTKRFLRANIDQVFGFPSIVRDSWSTAFDLLEKRAATVKWEVEEVTGAPPSKISKFFVKKESETETDGCDENFQFVKPKSQFFTYRDLTQTNTLLL